MAIGDDGDFRTLGFGHVLRFPPQGLVGGSGSALLPQFTPPAGSSNEQLPFPPFGSLPTPYPFPGLNFPGFPPIISGGFGVGGSGGTGPGGPGTITVTDLNTSTTYTDIDTLEFSGLGLSVTSAGPGVATIDVPGGGAGSTLVYGKITAASKNATKALWTYTVKLYDNGNALPGTITALNLLEKENTAVLAYGYTVTSATGDLLSGTSFRIKSVPIDTWVRLESTNDITGSATYWFSAPNRIEGSC